MSPTDLAVQEQQVSGKRATGGQRLHDPGCDRQRLRQPVVEQRADALDLSDGRAGQRQEHVPVEHRRPADLVHDPREQRRLDRAQKGSRHHDLHESGDRAEDVLTLQPGAPVHLRRAAETQSDAQRHHLLPVPFAKLAGELSGREAAQTRANMIYVGIVAERLGIEPA